MSFSMNLPFYLNNLFCQEKYIFSCSVLDHKSLFIHKCWTLSLEEAYVDNADYHLKF